jgi:hypothetical protein
MRDGGGPVDTARDESGDRRDQTPAHVMSGGVSGMSGVGTGFYIAVVVIILVIVTLNGFSNAHDRARFGQPYALGPPMFWEWSSGLVIIALLPWVGQGIARLRFAWTRGRWAVAAALALGCLAAFSVVHILGMVGLRKLVMAALGGGYDFSWSLSNLAYEFRKDAGTFALLGTAFWLALSRRDARMRAELPAVAMAEPQSSRTLWLQDGTSRLRVEADEVIWVASAGNYAEYRLSGGRNRLIRTTLAGEEALLQPFRIVRVHRTRLVNLDRVVEVVPRPSGDFELRLDTGETVAGSRRYRAAIDRLLQQDA